jgi:hypothetical protein
MHYVINIKEFQIVFNRMIDVLDGCQQNHALKLQDSQ